MKTNKLTRIAGAGLMTIVPLFTGCQSDSGLAIDFLKIKIGHQQATGLPEESQTPVGQAIFKTDAQPYDKSEDSNGAINSTLWKHYQNQGKK